MGSNGYPCGYTGSTFTTHPQPRICGHRKLVPIAAFPGHGGGYPWVPMGLPQPTRESVCALSRVPRSRSAHPNGLSRYVNQTSQRRSHAQFFIFKLAQSLATLTMLGMVLGQHRPRFGVDLPVSNLRPSIYSFESSLEDHCGPVSPWLESYQYSIRCPWNITKQRCLIPTDL
jgi:hypothetical protein